MPTMLVTAATHNPMNNEWCTVPYTTPRVLTDVVSPEPKLCSRPNVAVMQPGIRILIDGCRVWLVWKVRLDKGKYKERGQ